MKIMSKGYEIKIMKHNNIVPNPLSHTKVNFPTYPYSLTYVGIQRYVA
jgi:hypothetical protein